jgi:hypothetical protein
MSKLFENECDAEAQAEPGGFCLRALNEAGIRDCWIAREAGLFRVVWYI